MQGFDHKDVPRLSMTILVKSVDFNLIWSLKIKSANNALCDVAGNIQITVQLWSKASVLYPVTKQLFFV